MGSFGINRVLRAASGSKFLVRQLRVEKFDNRAEALEEVDKILKRGNAARMQDVFGGVSVTELQRV